MTKTGNTHVRRLLIEAAWHHRARYVVGKTMRDRWELATPAARARGDAGNQRLRQRRNRPRTRRLVLVPGPARGIDPQTGSVDHRGGSSAWSDPRHNYEEPIKATLDPRPADPLRPNTPSCGNQPAHISLTARRQRHAHHQPADDATRRPPQDNQDGRLTLPLDNKPLRISCGHRGS
ncbi:hypothetical protein ACXC9Q_41625 [Kribbella sp. CWNU-51]